MEPPFPALFEQYARGIAALPKRDSLLKTDLFVERFLVFKSGGLEIYYAPFDFVNVEAKVAIVGITPGWTQMEIAFRRASTVMKDGGTATAALQNAKQEASFAGTMRKNLVKMLDEVGLHQAVGLKSSEYLFGGSRHLVHTTSVVRHPVFVHGRNYTGHSPDVLSHPMLARYATKVFAEELAALPQPLVVPLGRCVDSVFQHLIRIGVLNASRCLLGFPHPSGANGHRKIDFEQRRDGFMRVVEEWVSQA